MIEQVAPTNVSLDDLEDLINTLSPDEIAELAECDPDVSKINHNNQMSCARTKHYKRPVKRPGPITVNRNCRSHAIQ